MELTDESRSGDSFFTGSWLGPEDATVQARATAAPLDANREPFREVRLHMCKGQPNDCEVPAELRVAAEEVTQYVAEQEHALHDGTLAAVKPWQQFCRGTEGDSGHDHRQ